MNWHDLFTYEAYTGNLIWRSRPLADFESVANCVMWNKRFAGTVAGCRRKNKVRRCGIWVGIIDGGVKKFHGAHLIVWEMHHGKFPDGYLPDHVDGDSWNNRITNLRPATPSQNSFNAKLSSKNASRLKGVWYASKDDKWMCKLTVRGNIIRLGAYPTKGLAAVARAKAAIRHHGEFARLT